MGLPAKGMLLIGAPLARKQDPRNVVDGQFSGPFVVACALARGHFGWDSYAWLNEPDIRRLLPLVTCEEDPEIEAEFPANMSGKVTVRMRGGRALSRTVVVPKGEPSNFLTETELRAKFHGLCDAVLGAERAAQLADAVLTLDRAPDVNGMMRLGAPLMAARLAGE
jgi:2-methylcitrate dehydratase PrpD